MTERSRPSCSHSSQVHLLASWGAAALHPCGLFDTVLADWPGRRTRPAAEPAAVSAAAFRSLREGRVIAGQWKIVGRRPAPRARDGAPLSVRAVSGMALPFKSYG